MTNTQTSQQPPKQQNNMRTYIIAGVVAVLIIAGIGIFALLNNKKGDSNQATNNSSSQSTSNNQNTSTAGNSAGTPVGQLPSEATKKLDEVAKKDRESLDKYLVSAKTNRLTLETVSQIKKTPETPVFKTETGKRVKLSIRYSSVGDKDFEEGSLYVKLDKGLKVVAVRDNFLDKGDVNVDMKLVDSSKNILIYGPGSKDKTSSKVKVGERGVLTMVVEVTTPSDEGLSVRSFLQDKSGKAGKPGIMFIETK